MRVLSVDGNEVLLDDFDWVRLCRYKWKIRHPRNSTLKYICVNKVKEHNGEKKRRTIYLHRAIVAPPYGLDLKPEEEVHHINGNTLDNRRENLEIMKRDKHGKLTRENGKEEKGDINAST